MLTPGIEERLVRNDETRDRRTVGKGMTTRHQGSKEGKRGMNTPGIEGRYERG